MVKINPNLKEIVTAIVNSVRPQQIILFGSRARGSNTTYSDYDLLVVKQGVKNERNLSRKIHQALYESAINQDVDIVVVDAGKFNRQKHNPYLIYSWALKEGKVLYG